MAPATKPKSLIFLIASFVSLSLVWADVSRAKQSAPLPITREEGEAFVDEYLKGVSAGFVKNNHREILGHLYADQMSWDWADGTKVGLCHSLFIYV